MITETEGIVLRQIKTINGRRMVLLFSKKFGKISAGTGISEKSRSKASLAMRPFTYGRYELFKNRDSFNINSAETLKSYYKIGEDVDKYMNASYVLELTEKITVEEQPMPGLLNLLLDFLAAMETRKTKYGTLVLAYELKALKFMGLVPRLEECCCCGKPPEKTGREDTVFFNVKEGGIMCSDCRKEIEEQGNEKLIYKMNFVIVDVLKYFLSNPIKSIENLALDEKTFHKLQAMIKAYLDYHLDVGKLKSESFMGEYKPAFLKRDSN